jgi:hypothetical protein
LAARTAAQLGLLTQTRGRALLVKVEICPESAAEITRAELRFTLQLFKRDLRQRKAGNGSPVFTRDKAEDIEQIKQHIEAAQMLLRYYGG